MKKHLLTVCLLGASLTATAQKAYEITGTVADSLTKSPDVYATVRLLSTADGKPLRAVTTDTDGKFKISVSAPGTYRIEASILGKAPATLTVTVKADEHATDCGTIFSHESGVTLGTAEVTATKPLVKADVDKLTYSVTDDPDAQGSSLLDMLRKVPMVTVDGDDKIKVKGQTGFKVYVNGKPNKMMSQDPSQIFKTYPASAVKKIEVITNPGAKYDAEGTTGVLNIITSDNTKSQGYLLTPSVSVTNSDWMGSLFAMAQVGKFTFSLNYGAGYFKGSANRGEAEAEYFENPVNHYQNTQNYSRTKGTYQFGDLEASYEFSPKDLLSVSAGIYGFNGRTRSGGVSEMRTEENALSYGYDATGRQRNTSFNTQAAADYQHTFAEDRRLTLSYRYDIAPTSYRRDLTYTALRGTTPALQDLRADKDEHATEHTVQADFTTPFGKAHTLSLGAKHIMRLNSSQNSDLTRPSATQDDFTPDDEQAPRFRHRSSVTAAYAEYGLTAGKFSLRAGCRYEYFHTNATYPDGHGTPFSANMGDWVPSLSAGWPLSDTQMLRASYDLRVSRPGINTLNPYVKKNAAEQISYGNPLLTSEHTHNIELGYSYFGPKLSVNFSAGYIFANDMSAQYSFIRDGIINLTYGQDMRMREGDATLYARWAFTKTTKLTVNANLMYWDYRSAAAGDHCYSWHATFYGGLEQDLPWKLTASLSGGSGTKETELQTQTSGWWYYMLSLSRKFLRDERLYVRLFAQNFLPRHMTFSSTMRTPQFYTHTSSTSDRLNFGISVSYRLGSLKAQVKKADRTIENDDRGSKSSGSQGGSGGGR